MNFQEEHIIELLKQKLFDLGIEFDDFCNLLIENKAILSGSFLLQVIYKHFHGWWALCWISLLDSRLGSLPVSFWP